MTAVPLLAAAAPRFGRVLGTRVAGDFHLRLSRYDGSADLPAHRHPDAYFCYVVDGGVDERSSGRDRGFGPGSLHFHPAGEPHACRTGRAGLQSLSIAVTGRSAAEARVADRGWEAPRSRPLAILASRCWAAFLAPDRTSDLELEGAATELLAAARGGERANPGAAPGWVGTVRDYLHASWLSEVTLADLAAIAGVHPVHVVRGFRRATGLTPGAYLRQLRLEAARRALLDTALPLAEIAFAAGFYDQAHFTREFRRAIGLTPAAFRRLHAPLGGPRPSARFTAS